MKLRDVVGRKWSIEILFLLDEGNHTFSELLKHFQVSSRILTNRLDELRRAGIILRTLQEDRTTIYSLSDKGRKVVKLLRELEVLLKT